MLLPVAVGDYVDFYSSLHHATNLGRIFRPDGEPLLPNWRHLPVGYHGRAGNDRRERHATSRARQGSSPIRSTACRASRRRAQLDFELEVGFVVGGATATRIAPDDADAHVFGAVLCNDWSARDIQALRVPAARAEPRRRASPRRSRRGS